MKTKKIFFTLAALAAALAVTFTACRKNTDGPGDDLKLGSDNAKAQTDIDEGGNVVSEAFSFTSQSMRVASPQDLADIQAGLTICGATIDTSQLTAQKLITITFDGDTPCNGKIRSGVITGKLITGAKWRDVGAQLLVTFTNYKVENIFGDSISLSEYAGKKLMVVNTASFCGYTHQFSKLQQLDSMYSNLNFLFQLQ
jgi:hypothetical protein